MDMKDESEGVKKHLDSYMYITLYRCVKNKLYQEIKYTIMNSDKIALNGIKQ